MGIYYWEVIIQISDIFRVMAPVILRCCHFVRYRVIHKTPCENNKNNDVGKNKMLPRKLYELLPFLYILTGIICAALIDSSIVLISSMLLIIAGIFVFLLRRNFRKSLNQRYQLQQALNESAMVDVVEKRSGLDRRCRVTERPVLDNAGEKIFSDRRIAERRVSAM